MNNITDNKKLAEFLKRNARRNADLYEKGKVEGDDYVVCPVSNYIKSVLGMSEEEYYSKYPNVQRVSKALNRNISKGVTTVDPETGLTKHAIAVIKSKETLSKVDETGVSGYAKKGQKTRATHMSKIDELGRNGYQRQVHSRLTTVLGNGLTVEQNAHKKQKEVLLSKGISRVVGASKVSKKVLAPIISLLTESNVKFYFDKQEYMVRDAESGNCFFWDLTIPDFQLAIEYQSDSWHAAPMLTDDKWNNWAPPKGKRKTADEVLKYDYDKARILYRGRGFVTYYVWESSQEQDVNDLLCLLKTMITKF